MVFKKLRQWALSSHGNVNSKKNYAFPWCFFFLKLPLTARFEVIDGSIFSIEVWETSIKGIYPSPPGMRQLYWQRVGVVIQLDKP